MVWTFSGLAFSGLAFKGLAFKGLAFRGFSTLPLAASPKAEHTEQQAEQFEHGLFHNPIHATER